jgi:predicted RNA binding protein YcfA (HicA-like mRNA interferase family)
MKQWTHEEFCRMAGKNGFQHMRSAGSHSIYVNNVGHHMSIPKNLSCVIARRLIKENNLNINLKKKI